jgi:hypothetical protein
MRLAMLLAIALAAGGEAAAQTTAGRLTDQLLDLNAAVVQPGTYSDTLLQRAIVLKENEILAQQMVQAARRLHRAGDRGNKLNNLLYFLSRRAGDAEPLVDGPYLKNYAELLLEIVEEELARPAGWGLTVNYRPLLVYLAAHPEDERLRTRVLALARPLAKVADLPPPPEVADPVAFSWEHQSWNKVRFAWQVLFRLGLLKDGMELAAAKQLLGEPTRTRTYRGVEHSWIVPTGFRLFTGLMAEERDGKLTFRNFRR